MGWTKWFAVGGEPLNIEPDKDQTTEEIEFPEERKEEDK